MAILRGFPCVIHPGWMRVSPSECVRLDGQGLMLTFDTAEHGGDTAATGACVGFDEGAPLDEADTLLAFLTHYRPYLRPGRDGFALGDLDAAIVLRGASQDEIDDGGDGYHVEAYCPARDDEDFIGQADTTSPSSSTISLTWATTASSGSRSPPSLPAAARRQSDAPLCVRPHYCAADGYRESHADNYRRTGQYSTAHRGDH